jgi:hypothetical protein
MAPIASHMGRTYAAEALETLKRAPAPEWA